MKKSMIAIENPISIADCLTIALTKKIGGKELFLKTKKEFEKVLENKSFETELTFFNELI